MASSATAPPGPLLQEDLLRRIASAGVERLGLRRLHQRRGRLGPNDTGVPRAGVSGTGQQGAYGHPLAWNCRTPTTNAPREGRAFQKKI